jgi:uncharacterized protein YjfI (DUF2170 family)
MGLCLVRNGPQAKRRYISNEVIAHILDGEIELTIRDLGDLPIAVLGQNERMIQQEQ